MKNTTIFERWVTQRLTINDSQQSSNSDSDDQQRSVSHTQRLLNDFIVFSGVEDLFSIDDFELIMMVLSVDNCRVNNIYPHNINLRLALKYLDGFKISLKGTTAAKIRMRLNNVKNVRVSTRVSGSVLAVSETKREAIKTVTLGLTREQIKELERLGNGDGNLGVSALIDNIGGDPIHQANVAGGLRIAVNVELSVRRVKILQSISAGGNYSKAVDMLLS